MSEIRTDNITLKPEDGSSMGAYVARPADDGRHPGILVYQEIFGVNHHIRSVAERFARQGFVAIAPDLFHRSVAGFQGTYDDIAPGMNYAKAMQPDQLRADIRATHQWLSEHVVAGKMASVGFCLGGSVSAVTNSIVPLAAAISFYGGMMTTYVGDHFGDMKAPMLLFWGGLDKHITPPVRQQTLEAFGAHNKPFVNVEFSDADHGFFCDERASYNAAAAAQAWALALAFLQAHLG